MFTLAAALACASWLYLALWHGRFWRADQYLEPAARPIETAPAVVAVVPARDEADVIGRSVASLLNQDYPGLFQIILVDDRSSDGTAAAAHAAAWATGKAHRLTVVTAPPLEPGWTGKLWAIAAGLREAATRVPDARYVLLTDADIHHTRDNLSRLVDKAAHDRCDLVSLMVMLH